MTIKPALLIILFASLLQPAPASIKTAIHGADVLIGKHEVVDIVFYSRNELPNPFEADFGATVTAPNGDSRIIHGFHNGSKEWILRFSAGQNGVWKYEIASSIPHLNGEQGQVRVVAGDADRRGGVTISKENPRKFAYEDGSPYFLNGFECDWLFALDGENSESAPKTKHLLSLLAQNGINQIVTTLYSYDVAWDKDDKLASYPEHEYGGRDALYPFLGTNRSPDFSSLNVEFFKRFDRVVELMDERGIVAHLMIYVFNKKVKWPKEGSLEDNRYYDYVIKRYGAFPNVVWDPAKEIFRRSEAYAIDRLERLRQLNTYQRLVTVHDKHFAEKYPHLLDFIARQDWRADIHAHMLRLYEQYEKPVVNVEHGGYEESYYEVFPGDYTDPEICLRRGYLCYFAGVYSNYYWQGAAWNAIIHNPFEQPESFPKPKFEYYRHLSEFFTRHDYNDFSPHTDHTLSGYALKSENGLYLFYIPKENYQLSNYGGDPFNKTQGSYQWFNTLTGEYTQARVFEGGHFVSPWRGKADAILIRDVNR